MAKNCFYLVQKTAKKYPLGYWSKESFRKKYGYSKEINDRFVVEVVNDPKKIVKQIKDSKGYYLCNRPYPKIYIMCRNLC